jgi:hypothetical protein
MGIGSGKKSAAGWHGASIRVFRDDEMKNLLVAGLLLCATQASYAEIYKCKTEDGRTIFSSSGCGTESGVAEQPELKINEVGSLASDAEIRRLQRERAMSKSHGAVVNYVPDSSKDTERKQRLRMKEDYIDRSKRPHSKIVDVVPDSGRESDYEKSVRLRREMMELHNQ